MRILIAPDSFKGTASAKDVAESIRSGWLAVRPRDEVYILPLADGGEGTLEVIAAARPGAVHEWVRVLGPAGPVMAPWLLCPDGTAVVELARGSGLPLLDKLDALGSHTFGFGQLMTAAVSHRSTRRLVATLGGSASTDGGTGALAALGVRFVGDDGLRLPLGGGNLHDLVRVDATRLVPAPVDGVEILVDVDAPLLGPDGAACQFAPQKGAAPRHVAILEAGLSKLATVLGADPATAGFGAAGGTAYGLASLWKARLVPGAARVADIAGLAEYLTKVDLVITGEGHLDQQSLRGKVVGHVAHAAQLAGVPVWACVGQQTGARPSLLAGSLTLTRLAGSVDAAIADPPYWLEQAGMAVARSMSTTATSTTKKGALSS